MTSSTKLRIVARSSNTNAFGLHGYILEDEQGNAWQAGRSLYFPLKVGATITIDRDARGHLRWERHLFELRRYLGKRKAS